MKWRQRFDNFASYKHHEAADQLNALKEILNGTSHESLECPKECSEIFKFFSGVAKIRPDSLSLIVCWVLEQDDQGQSFKCEAFPRGLISFLARLKKTVRRNAFEGQISKLWPLIFNHSGGDLQKVFLIREYRRELSFDWLLSYIMSCDYNNTDGFNNSHSANANFFYLEDLNVAELSPGGAAVIEILLEVLEKGRQAQSNESSLLELRVSGVLEKIGSLWRSESIKFNPKILKLLALASSVASVNIFDSLSGVLEVLDDNFKEEGEVGDESSSSSRRVWTIRLIESILKKFPKRQYILSAMRAELQTVSHHFVSICGSALKSPDLLVLIGKQNEFCKSTVGLLKCVLERWNDLACRIEGEQDFIKRVAEYLEADYKRRLLMIQKGQSSTFSLIYIFSRHFIDPLRPLLPNFFRNSLKQLASTCDNDSEDSLCFEALKEFSRLLVLDGGTDRAFPLLFQKHPSLIDDIHNLIKESEEKCRPWLLILAESPRTYDPLIEFILNPEQITSVISDSFWQALLARLVKSTERYETIDAWLDGSLKGRFIESFEAFDPADRYQVKFFKLIIPMLSVGDLAVDSVLRVCKQSSALLEWLVTAYEGPLEIDYFAHLKDFSPFDGSQITTLIYEKVKKSLNNPNNLLDCIFNIEKECRHDCTCLLQWNLLVKSGNLHYAEDSGNDFVKDFSGYLERLFSEFSNNNESIDMIASEDMIETYMNYYKYGNSRAMFSMHATLLQSFSRKELLLRIPLVVLRSTGRDFGLKILNDFLENGWEDEGEGEGEGEFQKSYGDYFAMQMQNLKAYYQSRLIM